MKFKAGTLGHKYGTYEYICNDCGHCSSDYDVIANVPDGVICRCTECGSRNLSEHRIEEGWDCLGDSRDAMSIFPIRYLRLVDLMPYLPNRGWFTIVKRTGEVNNSITYTYPERFRVCKIEYCRDEDKIAVIVEEIYYAEY